MCERVCKRERLSESESERERVCVCVCVLTGFILS